MAQNKMREEMTEAFIAALKENKIPWRRGWEDDLPVNAVTGKKYRSNNMVWLSYLATEKKYKDPRWCTYKQAADSGWQVKKGEKGAHIEFWSLYDLEEKKKITFAESIKLREELSLEEYTKRVKPVSNGYTVFNGEQIDGIPEYDRKHEEINPDEILDYRDKLLRNMNLTLSEGGHRAFYRESADSITMPLIEKFENNYEYMSTFLHECGHATGHSSRLNRDLSGTFGSESYAKEELRAEISSAFTTAELGINTGSETEHMKNHKAYIQSWVSVLENDPNELFRAIKDAEKISDYLIEKGEFKVQTEESKQEEAKENALSATTPDLQEKTYKLYQMNEDDKYHGFHFAPLEENKKFGTLTIDDYHPVYEGNFDDVSGDSTLEKLESLFAEQVDMVIANKMEQYNNLKVCDTPQVLVDVGLRQLPILYTQRHLRDALHPKSVENSHWHGMTVEQIKKIPELLISPAIIFDSVSEKNPNSIGIVLNAVDNDNAPIMVTVKPNGIGVYELEQVESNFITSIYGKDTSFDNYIDRIAESDKILFIDKEKSQELFSCLQLQLPQAINNLNFDKIIHQSETIVNSQNETNREVNSMDEYTKEENTQTRAEQPEVKKTVKRTDLDDAFDLNHEIPLNMRFNEYDMNLFNDSGIYWVTQEAFTYADLQKPELPEQAALMPEKEQFFKSLPDEPPEDVLKDAERELAIVEKKLQNESEDNVFRKQLDKYFNGSMKTNEIINVCSTPNILKLMGSEARKVVLNQNELENSISKSKRKNHTEGHEIEIDELYKLPSAIRNPIMVLRGNRQNKNSIVLLTDLTNKEGQNILIPIALDRQNGKINNISSLYGKKNLNNYINSHVSDILALNIKKENFLADTGVQFPQSINETVVLFDDSIVYSMENVKGINENSQQMLHSIGKWYPEEPPSVSRNETIHQNEKNVNIQNEINREVNNMDEYTKEPEIEDEQIKGKADMLSNNVSSNLPEQSDLITYGILKDPEAPGLMDDSYMVVEHIKNNGEHKAYDPLEHVIYKGSQKDCIDIKEKLTNKGISKEEAVQLFDKAKEQSSFQKVIEEFKEFAEEHKSEIKEKEADSITIVINAFAGPGAGKTVACMDICAALKKDGYNAEYVQEYAKELVYEGNMEKLSGSIEGQWDIMKEQISRVDRLIGKTDFIVTDSPALLNSVYLTDNSKTSCMYEKLAAEVHSHYDNFSFFLNRDTKVPFQEEGRIHDFNQSVELDNKIKNMLKRNNVFCCNYNRDSVEKIVKNAEVTLTRLNDKKKSKQKEQQKEDHSINKKECR